MQVKCKSNENTNSIIKAKIAIMIVRSGRRGRGFESRHLDHIAINPHNNAGLFLSYTIYTRKRQEREPLPCLSL